jgi:hypothetical protein
VGTAVSFGGGGGGGGGENEPKRDDTNTNCFQSTECNAQVIFNDLKHVITLCTTCFKIKKVCILSTYLNYLLRMIFTISIVTCISIARQRLGKNIPAQANSRNNRTYIARQRISKNTSITIEDVFSAWFVQSGYKEVFGST